MSALKVMIDNWFVSEFHIQISRLASCLLQLLHAVETTLKTPHRVHCSSLPRSTREPPCPHGLFHSQDRADSRKLLERIHWVHSSSLSNWPGNSLNPVGYFIDLSSLHGHPQDRADSRKLLEHIPCIESFFYKVTELQCYFVTKVDCLIL